ATGAGGVVLGARGLRVTAESLVSVSLGLVVLDVLGAERAGWIGGPDGLGDAGLVLTVGLALALAGAALTATPQRLAAPQLVGVSGLFLALTSLPSHLGHDLLLAAVSTVVLAALAVVAHTASGLLVTAWTAAVAAALAWCDLTVGALSRLDRFDEVTVGGLWTSGSGIALLAAALLLLAPLAVRRDEPFAQAWVVAALSMTTGLVVLPVADNGVTDVALASLVAGVLWTSLAHLVDRRRLLVPAVPAALSLLPGAVVALQLVGQAVESALTPTSALRLDPADPVAAPALLVPLVVAVVALGVVVLPATARQAALTRVAPVVLLLAAIATLALHPVPLWTLVASLGLVAAAYVADGLRRPDAIAQVLLGTALLLVALGTSAPSTALTLVPLLLITATGAAAHLVGRPAGSAEIGALLLPAALAGSTWVVGVLAGLDAYRAVPVLVVLGALVVLRPRVELEAVSGVAAAVAAVVAVPLATDESVSLALHLTLAGALVVAHSLVHPSRRPLAALGTGLLVLATWVRLADLGVTAPEPYTLPTAVLLLAVGLHRMRRDDGSSTALTLLPGLLLATVPSYLQLLVTDPVSPRAAVLGVACLVLAVGGAQLRWSAPLLVGSVVGGLLVLLELAPYAAQTPQWVVIGIAGTTLVVAGTTWERRVVEVQRAAQYVGRMR
ncbi:MAG: hypothetical protein JWN84_4646, partial [Nocardioides sp.]|nr:hypothetical protein [Nocardioides sp.]